MEGLENEQFLMSDVVADDRHQNGRRNHSPGAREGKREQQTERMRMRMRMRQRFLPFPRAGPH